MANIEKIKSNIGFLVWYQVFSHVNESQQNSIVNLIKEICKYVENEINSNGGIAGKKIKVHFLIVPENTDQAKENFENYLKEYSDIMFICQAPNYYKIDPEKKICQELLDKFKGQPYIVFDSVKMFLGNYSLNFFDTDRVSVSGKNVLKIIDLLFTPNNIFVVKLKDFKTNFSKDDLNCKVIEININEIKNQNNSELKILDELKKCSMNDIIYFSNANGRDNKISFISEYVKSDTKAKLILDNFDVRNMKIIYEKN